MDFNVKDLDKTMTRFDPDNIKEWHKVSGFSYNFYAQTTKIIFFYLFVLIFLAHYY